MLVIVLNILTEVSVQRQALDISLDTLIGTSSRKQDHGHTVQVVNSREAQCY